MEIEVKKVHESGNCLILVPSEKLDTDAISDIETITSGDKKYKMHFYFTQPKDEYFQNALFFLALGKEIEPEQIWAKYPKSEIIYLFVCEPL